MLVAADVVKVASAKVTGMVGKLPFVSGVPLVSNSVLFIEIWQGPRRTTLKTIVAKVPLPEAVRFDEKTSLRLLSIPNVLLGGIAMKIVPPLLFLGMILPKEYLASAKLMDPTIGS